MHKTRGALDKQQKAESLEEKIRAAVFYIIDTYDKDVVNSYTTIFMDIINEHHEKLDKQNIEQELTDFLDFLLKNGYCDSDVYCEEPTAIERYLIKKQK